MDLKQWALDHGATGGSKGSSSTVAIGEGPWRLYIYGKDGYHSGSKWFRKGPMKYPDEEITAQDAKERVLNAMRKRCEVRICDRGDRLVFHSEGGMMIAPPTANEFWAAAGLTA